jgi:hypothetical protein
LIIRRVVMQFTFRGLAKLFGLRPPAVAEPTRRRGIDAIRLRWSLGVEAVFEELGTAL